MNIVSWRSPVPGIEPRMPIVSGCAGVLHTSTVAQIAVDPGFGQRRRGGERARVPGAERAGGGEHGGREAERHGSPR